MITKNLYFINDRIWSWTFWFIGLYLLKDEINQESIGKFLIFFFSGVYGPSISAIVTTFIFDGIEGVLNYLSVIWNVPLKNYLYIIILPTIFVIIGIGLYNIFIGDIGSFDLIFLFRFRLYCGLNLCWTFGRELGWRGHYPN